MGVVTKLPKKINAIRVVTYDVDDEMLDEVVEANELSSKEDVTAELLLEHLEDWIHEDMNNSERTIHVQDEWGDELKQL
jgi:hypothetical protein